MTESINNIVGEAFVRVIGRTASYLDEHNILWKVIGGNWIGKRSVWTWDYKAVWLSETTKKNVKSWWCGEMSDYDEVFIRQAPQN